MEERVMKTSINLLFKNNKIHQQFMKDVEKAQLLVNESPVIGETLKVAGKSLSMLEDKIDGLERENKEINIKLEEAELKMFLYESPYALRQKIQEVLVSSNLVKITCWEPKFMEEGWEEVSVPDSYYFTLDDMVSISEKSTSEKHKSYINGRWIQFEILDDTKVKEFVGKLTKSFGDKAKMKNLSNLFKSLARFRAQDVHELPDDWSQIKENCNNIKEESKLITKLLEKYGKVLDVLIELQ